MEIVVVHTHSQWPLSTVRELLLKGSLEQCALQFPRAHAILYPLSNRTSAFFHGASATDAVDPNHQIRFRDPRSVAQTGLEELADSICTQVPKLTITVKDSEGLDEPSRMFFRALTVRGASVSFEVGFTKDPVGTADFQNPELIALTKELEAYSETPDTARFNFLLETVNKFLHAADVWSAKKLLQQLFKVQPKNAWLAFRLGLAHVLLDETIEAEWFYKRCYETGTKLARLRVCYNLAMLFSRHHPRYLQDVPKARAYLTEAFEIIDSACDDEIPGKVFERVFNRNGFSYLLFREGKVAEAAHAVAEGIAYLEATNDEAGILHKSVLLFNLAQCYTKMGDIPKAYQTYRDLLEFDPQYQGYYLYFVRELIKNRDFAEAREVLAAAEKVDAWSPDIHAYKGYLCFQEENLVGSCAAYRTAYEHSGKDPQRAYDYLFLLVNLGQLEAAKAIAAVCLRSAKESELHAKVSKLLGIETTSSVKPSTSVATRTVEAPLWL